MRPPSYYTSLANSNSSSTNRNSSQQLRSSFSSSSSTSYATRTHLPFAPQTMLVAHCYTGVASSTKPYGQPTSSLYSSGNRFAGSTGLGSTAASYTSSSYSSSRPSSTKRHHHFPSSSSSSSSSSFSSSSALSSSAIATSGYTPRSSARYLSSSTTTPSSCYPRRPSAYAYQPIRLRERPLLTRISNQFGQQRYETNSAADSRRPPPSGRQSAVSSTSTERPIEEETTRDSKESEAEQNWSSDVARNISRNKYLIKFREFDKGRPSLVPEPEPDRLETPTVCLSSEETKNRRKFETQEGPNISVTVKLATNEEAAAASMRLPPVESQVDKQGEDCADLELADDSLVVSKNLDECDKQTTTEETSKDTREVRKVKVPKEKRNIKLRIKNLNPLKASDDQNVVAGAAIAGAGDEDQPTASVKLAKKKAPVSGESKKADTLKDAAATPTKTKVKRPVKSGRKKSEPSEPSTSAPTDGQNPLVAEPKSELKAKDSLLTKRLSDRKVLSPKQLNFNSSSFETSNETTAGGGAKEVDPISKITTPTTGSSDDHSSPKSADPTRRANKRIRFREYNYQDFNFLSVLGHGGWGFVILAELKNHDACFAVKCIKKITIVEDDDFDSIMIERKVLTLGNVHPFICKLFCTFETEGYLFFAMEYCAGGDLMFHVQREGKFTEARSRFYAAEIICAIKFLHNQHIIYRDLKLDNILLDSRGHIRLVDFGMCQCRTYREEMLPSNFCGTPEYISPEIIKGVPYNHSVDWWSFGVLLYEMAVGKMPFRGNDENELLWNVCYEQIHYPMFLTKELTSLLQSLLEREPTKRMGMATCKAGDIYDQAWFRGVDWRAIEELRVPPPFVPEVISERDVQNFDSDFTQSTPELSPVDASTLKKIDQSQFQKFPYTNPNISIFG